MSKIATALVVGGADCVWLDLSSYDGPIDCVIACNCIGTVLPMEIDAWVSLHPLEFPRYVETRRRNGHPEAKALVTNQKDRRQPPYPPIDHYTHATFPGHPKGGSSGLFGAKLALMDYGFDRVVFCGVPLTPTGHAVPHPKWKGPHENYIFKTATNYQKAWREIPEEWRKRMSSMSGWTRSFLGSPMEKWK